MGYVNRAIAAAAIAAAALVFAAPADAKTGQVCGIFEPCFGADTAPTQNYDIDGERYDINLSTPNGLLRFGRRIQLNTSVFRDGAPVAGTTARLYATQWPFAGFQEVASTDTNGSGAASFSVRPSLNTRYLVRYDNLARAEQSAFVVDSAQLLVRTFGQLQKFELETPENRVVRMELRASFPKPFAKRLNKSKVRWYITRGKGDDQRLTKVGVSRANLASAKVVQASVIAPLPPGTYRFRGTFCMTAAVGADLGLGDPQPTRCP